MSPGEIGVVAVNSNSDYVAADFNPGEGLNARLVSFGIRIKYAGILLNRGGRIYALQEPNHTPLQAYGVGDLGGYNECEISIVSDDAWTTLVYKPATANEYLMIDSGSFPGTAYLAGTKSSLINSGFMGFMIVSAALATPFEFETYATFEVSGRGARGKTMSAANYADFGRIQTATAPPQFDHHPNKMMQLLASAGSFVGRNSESLTSIGSSALGFLGRKGTQRLMLTG
jgi:hypothetical protein